MSANLEEQLQRRAKTCVHYRSAMDNATCKAELPFPRPVVGVCFQSVRSYADDPPAPSCPRYQPLGIDAARAEEAATKVVSANVTKARAAIVERVGGKVAKCGTMPCPICAGEGHTLGYSIASNGHIFAKCTTPQCVRWAE